MSDMKRVYVVEREVTEPQSADTPVPTTWVSIGTYDTESEAIQHAQDPSIAEDTRVRQFWVESGPVVVVAGVRSKAQATDLTEVDMVEFKCLDHPTSTARGYREGAPPRCTDCGKDMVPASFGEDIRTLGDLKR